MNSTASHQEVVSPDQRKHEESSTWRLPSGQPLMQALWSAGFIAQEALAHRGAVRHEGFPLGHIQEQSGAANRGGDERDHANRKLESTSTGDR